MITETRTLLFAHSDLTEAIHAFDRDKMRFLPEGDLMTVEVTGRAEPAVRVIIQVSGHIFPKTINLSGSQVAAILIHYCIKNRIPIPKQAHKCIETIDGDVALLVNIGTEFTQSSGFDEKAHAGNSGAVGA